MFDYPTVDALSAFISSQLGVRSSAAQLPASAQLAAESSSGAPVCLAGVDSRLAAGCDLSRSAPGLSPVPLSRWDAQQSGEEPGGALGSWTPRLGGFLGGVECFDGAPLSISASEAEWMDPQQRLLLECVWGALGALSHGGEGSSAGVWVGGAGSGEYSRLAAANFGGLSPHLASGNAGSVLCGRLSYVFGMQGPCVSVDTICSASLVGLHLCASSLRAGECGWGVACGVNLMLAYAQTRATAFARMLAPDGRCKTLDASADGYVRGEACIAAHLARVSGSGPSAAALVHGSAVNQDGRSSSLTAPNGPAQQALLRDALRAACTRGELVGRLEMHGTGTALGDPIELAAASAVLAEEPLRSGMAPLSLGAAKSSAGHAEMSAGLVAVSALLEQSLGASSACLTQLRQLNPHVTGIQERVRAKGLSPAVAPRQSTAAPASGPVRCMGVSAFAFQGTNAHAVLSAPAVSQQPRAGRARAWQQQRVWCCPAPHALLWEAGGGGSRAGCVRVVARLGGAGLAYLWDHRVSGRALFPGAGFFELASASARLALAQAPGRPCAALASVSLDSPLALADGAGVVVTIACVLDAEGSFAVRPAEGSGASFVRGWLAQQRASPAALAGVGRDASAASATGPALSVGAGGSVRGAADSHSQGAQWAHPAATDASMQLLGSSGSKSSSSPAGEQEPARVPAALRAFAVSAPLSGRLLRCAALLARAPSSGDSSALSHHRLSGCDDAASSGACVLSGLDCRALRGQAVRADLAAAASAAPSSRCLYETAWQSACVDARASGHAFRRPRPLARPSPRPGPCVGGLQGLVRACASALELSVCASAVGARRPRLVLETWSPSGGLASPAGSLSGPESACGGVRGLLRSAGSELGAVRTALVHRDGCGGAARGRGAAAGVCVAALSGGAEVSWRGGGALLARLLPSSAGESAEQLQVVPWPRGSLSGLLARPLEAAEPALARALVEVRVMAVGLNFRDVLNVLGLYPGDAGAPGSDCACLAVGGRAPAVRAGDAVFGLAVGGLGTRTRGAAELLPPKPRALRFEAAASLPTVYVTADAALRSAGCATGAGRLLVHAGSDGLGLALAQVAASAGCLAAATCGSSGKRALLRSLRVRSAGGSRDTRFAEALACAMGVGRGVSVVVNSLTSAGLVAASLSSLAAGGCLVELGKRDVWSRAAVGAQRQDVRSSLVAVDFLSAGASGRMLASLACAVSRGAVGAVPQSRFALGRAPLALRLLAAARHTGKVVVAAGAPAFSARAQQRAHGRPGRAGRAGGAVAGSAGGVPAGAAGALRPLGRLSRARPAAGVRRRRRGVGRPLRCVAPGGVCGGAALEPGGALRAAARGCARWRRAARRVAEPPVRVSRAPRVRAEAVWAGSRRLGGCGRGCGGRGSVLVCGIADRLPGPGQLRGGQRGAGRVCVVAARAGRGAHQRAVGRLGWSRDGGLLHPAASF